MTCETRTIRLKNGAKALIVPPDPERAEEMLDFVRDISSETEFITRTAGEVYETVDVEKEKLAGILASENPSAGSPTSCSRHGRNRRGRNQRKAGNSCRED